MKHCSLFCVGSWPFLLFPALLLLPVLYFSWHPIEELVANNVEKSIKTKFSWSEVETFNRGRDVLIAGEAPDLASLESMLAQARLARGANSVKFVGDIAVPRVLINPIFSLSLDDGVTVLAGRVDSQDSKLYVEQSVRQILNTTSIHNQLEHSTNVAKAPIMSNFILAFSKIDESGAIRLENNQLTLTGQVSSPDEKKLIGSIAALKFDGDIANQLEVVAPPCQDAIRSLLNDSRINFALESAEINSASDGLLAQIAAAATECQASQFEIVGHTDFTGSEEFNRALSQRRAEAVVNKLGQAGLDKNRFKTRGAGSTKPLSDNTTSTGRASNRRIEFRVTN